MKTRTNLKELFVKCAKEVIPTINEAGIEYCMRYCDIDEEGPVCSDGELMNIFRKNLSVYINDNEHFHGSSMNKVLITTKNTNSSNYIEVGIDINIPVLYVYKEGELFDWHFFGSTYAQEMKNLINCYTIVHGHEPSIQMINEFRCWCKALKDKNIIE